MSATWHISKIPLMNARIVSAWVLIGIFLALSLAFLTPPAQAYAADEQSDSNISLTLSARVGTRDATSSTEGEAEPATDALQAATGDGLTSVFAFFALAVLLASSAAALLASSRRRCAKETAKEQGALPSANSTSDSEGKNGREQSNMAEEHRERTRTCKK